MTITTRLIALGLALLITPNRGAAQLPLVYFTGERSIEMLSDVDGKDRDRLSTMGTRCGNHFLVQTIGDDEVVTFKVAVTKEEERRLMKSIVRIKRQAIEIVVNDDQGAATAAWVRSDAPDPDGWGRIRIRIATRDYNAAACLHR
jgi:hypothetical protein